MDRTETITKLVNQGLSIREIAKEESVSPNSISYWLKKLNLKVKRAKVNGIRLPKHDLTNKRFGKLIAIKRIKKRENNRSWYWLCKCDCGNEKEIRSAALLRGATRSCGCNKEHYKKITGKNSSQFKGYEEISGNWWGKLKKGAKKRNHNFDLEIEEIWYLFLKQDRKCKLSNLPIKLMPWSKNKETTASLDRIDSSKGYEINNVQWVHRKINFMKGQLDQKEFIDLCQKVTNYEYNNTSLL